MFDHFCVLWMYKAVVQWKKYIWIISFGASECLNVEKKQMIPRFESTNSEPLPM